MTFLSLLLLSMQAISSAGAMDINNDYLSSQYLYDFDNIAALTEEEIEQTLDSKLLLAKNDKEDKKDKDKSKAIEDTKKYLEETYSEYYWVCDEKVLTSDVSNAVPLNVGSDFPADDLNQAVEESGISSSYGGCGSIAMIGIFDYFARYLGYDSIMNDPTDSRDRIEMAKDVFQKTYQINIGENTLILPWDYVSACNSLLDKYGLGDIINCDYRGTLLFGGKRDELLDIIVEHVNEGLPVTMYTGLLSGDGPFGEHYTNIYGYEKWMGIKNDGSGERAEKCMLQARLNWKGWTRTYFADDSILDTGMMGIIYYDINYENSYAFYNHDFAEEFVNDNGGGQYFYYTISEPACLSNGKTIQTTRLRTSYIENKYLVLSPNREGAGTAYLDIAFPNNVFKFSFAASMWSSSEGSMNENFKIQYYDGGWKDHISIAPHELSILKEYPDHFITLFPKDTNRVRFYASCPNPGGDRNKGRICLDNFVVEYN